LCGLTGLVGLSQTGAIPSDTNAHAAPIPDRVEATGLARYPSHTTGRAVFRIRRLDSRSCAVIRPYCLKRLLFKA